MASLTVEPGSAKTTTQSITKLGKSSISTKSTLTHVHLERHKSIYVEDKLYIQFQIFGKRMEILMVQSTLFVSFFISLYIQSRDRD